MRLVGMGFVVKFVRQCIGTLLLGTLSFGAPCPYLRQAIDKQTLPALPLDSSAGAQDTMAGLFSRMTVRHHWQESHLDRLSVTRTYKVQNKKDKIVAEQVVVMEYTAPKTETFTSSSAKGSGFVLHHIFQQLMENERKRLRANKDPDTLITPENYTFEMIGTESIGGSSCTVVHALPKRKDTDLFEGRIWIDNQDFAIVKITGHLVKNPSFWIKRVDFARDYQKINGFWLLSNEKAISAVKVFGQETLTVDYRNYTVNGSRTLQSLSKNAALGIVPSDEKSSRFLSTREAGQSRQASTSRFPLAPRVPLCTTDSARTARDDFADKLLCALSDQFTAHKEAA